MSGCWLQALCLWLQAREAQQQQQPTTNERLMAARARAPHEAERQRGAHQRAVVKKRKQACGCKPEKHNSSNNLQPMSGCWLQALCLWLQARAPHEAERH